MATLTGAAVVVAALVFIFRSTATGKESDPRAPVLHLVIIRGMAFDPKVLQVAPGDSVQWTNRDIVPHAVKAADAKAPWESKTISPGESWTKIFTTGAAYFCPYHPTMTGEVVVAPN